MSESNEHEQLEMYGAGMRRGGEGSGWGRQVRIRGSRGEDEGKGRG
jgi:hypothetical protein